MDPFKHNNPDSRELSRHPDLPLLYDDARQSMPERHYLEAYLVGRASAKDTAEQLTSLLSISNKLLEEKTSTIWNLIIYAAKRLPVDNAEHCWHFLLVQLLQEIQKIPLIYEETQMKIWDMEMWQGLPKFQWNVLDNHNYYDPPASDPSQLQQRQEWVNFVDFLALCTLHLSLGFEVYALETFATTLEASPWNDPSFIVQHEELAREAEEIKGVSAEFVQDEFIRWKHEASMKRLDGWVPVVAIWMSVAGSMLWQKCKDEVGGYSRKSGNLWTGKADMFSIDRWKFWQYRLKIIASMSELDEKTRQTCTETVEMMGKISGASP